MRKSAVIVGFGAFFLTMALLLKFYAYDHLAVVPIDQNTQQTLNDPNATYFDARTVGFKTGELITRVTAVADKKASEDYGKNTVVLDKWQITNDPEGWRGNNQGKWQPQAASQERVAINRHTGLPVHCCDESIDGNPVSHEGYQIKLPFNVDKNTTYNYWDGNQRKAFPLKFQGEEKVNGLTTYKYLWQTPRASMRSRMCRDRCSVGPRTAPASTPTAASRPLPPSGSSRRPVCSSRSSSTSRSGSLRLESPRCRC